MCQPFSRKLRDKMEAFQDAPKFCVVSDWDRTLTRAQMPDGRDTSSYLAIVHGGYLGEAYREEMARLYARYRWMELATDIPVGEKARAMHDWGAAAFDLLKHYGLTREMIADVCRRELMALREGAAEFLRTLSDRAIPLHILSAGIGDVIEGFLAHRGLLTPNVRVTANRLVFDATGRVAGFEEPVIHSLNKRMGGGLTKDCGVLLLGDALEDAAMVSNAACKTIFRIGFLNADTESQRDAYLNVYDAVMGSKEGVSINQFISTAVSEKTSAITTEEYLTHRAQKAFGDTLKKILDKVPDRDPVPRDEL